MSLLKRYLASRYIELKSPPNPTATKELISGCFLILIICTRFFFFTGAHFGILLKKKKRKSKNTFFFKWLVKGGVGGGRTYVMGGDMFHLLA